VKLLKECTGREWRTRALASARWTGFKAVSYETKFVLSRCHETSADATEAAKDERTSTKD